MLSNNDYTLTATYAGTNGDNGTITLEFTTEAKATPEVEITVTDSTVSTLTYNVNYTDPDGVGKITAIALYNGDTLVQSETDLNQGEYTFSGLSSYTEYTLKVSYSYDLNDGVGTHNDESTLAENTWPLLTISSASVGNTSAVTEGGTIYITASVNNPNGVTYNSVVINDKTYSVLSTSNNSTIYVNISNDGQFAGGTTTLVISQITCTIDGKTYTIDISESNTVEVLIYGELTVENFYVARYDSTIGKYEETNYGFANEQLYYVVSLSNGTKYNIDSITIGGTKYSSSEITLSSDYQTVYIPVYTESVADTVSRITYSYGSDLNKTKTFSVSFGYFWALSSSNVVKITTAEQLLDVDDNAYYILMNDIDVSAYKSEWVNMNNNMYGVFDGNGYTISGLGATADYYDISLNIGLFNEVGGIVTNLTISANYNVTLKNTSSGIYSVSAGALAATSGAMVDNVNITFTAAITLEGNFGYYSGVSAGGISASGGYRLTNSTITTNIAVIVKGGDGNEQVNIGGVYGSGGISEVADTNVNFTANVTLESAANTCNIGGLSGTYDAKAIISDVTVNSNVTAVGNVTYLSRIAGIVTDGTLYLYGVTSNISVYLGGELYNYYLRGGIYADGCCECDEYVLDWGGSVTTDENCSGTITVNEIS